jgi:hypothetical protein
MVQDVPYKYLQLNFMCLSSSPCALHVLQCHRPLIPVEVIGFYSRSNPSSRTMALGSTQPLSEISTRNLPGDRGRPARKAENLTAIYESTV